MFPFPTNCRNVQTQLSNIYVGNGSYFDQDVNTPLFSWKLVRHQTVNDILRCCPGPYSFVKSFKLFQTIFRQKTVIHSHHTQCATHIIASKFGKTNHVCICRSQTASLVKLQFQNKVNGCNSTIFESMSIIVEPLNASAIELSKLFSQNDAIYICRYLIP